MTTDNRALHFLTCGHVDDGKSTLIGRLLYEMGVIPDDQIQSARDEQGEIDFSRLTDGLEDERAQGITIDVAYRYFRIGNQNFRIADTPGHQQYTRNMAVAAADCDCAMLLVDASHGIRPQTLYHSHILSFFNVKKIILVINKIDLLDYKSDVVLEIEKKYKDTMNHILQADIEMIPVSAIAGDNVSSKSERTPWYQGRSLREALLDITPQVVPESNTVRLPVQNVVRLDSTTRGYQGIVSGSKITVGDTLIVVDSQQKVTVSALYHAGETVDQVHPGSSITLGIKEDVDIARGHVVVGPSNPPMFSDSFYGELIWLDASYEQTSELQALIKIHHQEEMVQLQIESFTKPVARATFFTANPIVFDPFIHNQHTGLFLIIQPESEKVMAVGRTLPLPEAQGQGYMI